MTDKKDQARPKKGESMDARRERLAAELRANLLKRKAQNKARKGVAPSRDEGGQPGP